MAGTGLTWMGRADALIWHFIRTSVDDDDDDGETKGDDEDWLCSPSDGLYPPNLVQKKVSLFSSAARFILFFCSSTSLSFFLHRSPTFPRLSFLVFLAPFFAFFSPHRPSNPSCRPTLSSLIRGLSPLPTHLLLDRPENTCPAHRRVGIPQTC